MPRRHGMLRQRRPRARDAYGLTHRQGAARRVRTEQCRRSGPRCSRWPGAQRAPVQVASWQEPYRFLSRALGRTAAGGGARAYPWAPESVGRGGAWARPLTCRSTWRYRPRRPGRSSGTRWPCRAGIRPMCRASWSATSGRCVVPTAASWSNACLTATSSAAPTRTRSCQAAPAHRHRASFTVAPAAGGCRIIWHTEGRTRDPGDRHGSAAGRSSARGARGPRAAVGDRQPRLGNDSDRTPPVSRAWRDARHSPVATDAVELRARFPDSFQVLVYRRIVGTNCS